MKITFVLQSFPCISETFILNQITGLIDLGCDIRIIAIHQSRDEKQHPDIQKYNLLDKTSYINVFESKSARRIRAATQTMAAFIRHPILVYRVQKKLLKNGSSYSYPKLFLALVLICKQCDIIHCHYGTMGNKAIFIKEIGLKTTLSTVFHGYDLSAYIKSHGSDIYNKLFEKGDIFLPVSEFWKNRLIELGCPAEKIAVNHMGVDTEKFRSHKKEASGDTLNVLTVARLTEKKGQCYALQAIGQAAQVVPKLEYHIAGDGPLLAELKEMTKKLDIENRVVFHGKVDSDEVLTLYKEADIFLLPSVTPSSGDMEGIPVALMEAMACGIPVIASQHSGIPELVIDGQTGYAVPERDFNALAEKVRCLAVDDQLRIKLGDQAREYVKVHFNNQIVLDQLLEIFRGV
jgi:colanic acid/amylovoran biosynthesis glycosyltransferase